MPCILKNPLYYSSRMCEEVSKVWKGEGIGNISNRTRLCDSDSK